MELNHIKKPYSEEPSRSRVFNNLQSLSDKNDEFLEEGDLKDSFKMWMEDAADKYAEEKYSNDCDQTSFEKGATAAHDKLMGEDRWREKYYDTCNDLNIAEYEVEGLRKQCEKLADILKEIDTWKGWQLPPNWKKKREKLLKEHEEFKNG